MKIVSWNIGNFIFVKNPLGRKNYSFHLPDLPQVVELVKNEQADVVFLQEIHTESDSEKVFIEFPEFKFKTIVYNTSRFSKSIFMSKYVIEHIHHTESDDYIINGVTFFPIHLYAFSPKRRLAQCERLYQDLQHSKSVILGDTNLWIYNKLFISATDKKTYNMLISGHKDVLFDLGATCRFFLSLDKLFVTNDIKCNNAKIVKHKIGYIDHYLISCEINIK